MRFRSILGVIHLATIVCFIHTAEALALITGGTGNGPIDDRGWPDGAVDVANLKTRISWWDGPPFGGGESHFQYRGDTAAFNRALELFAKIRVPELELFVHEGTHASLWIKTSGDLADNHVDWEFNVWIPQAWHRLYNDPRSFFTSDQPNYRKPVAAPRIDVYVGGAVDWANVTVPKGIRIVDERAEALGVEAKDGGLLRGHVYDMATGKTVPGARILVADGKKRDKPERIAEAVTNGEGWFEVRKLPAGVHHISATAEHYAPRMIGHEQFKITTFKTYDVYLARSATIKGTVTDADGEPVAGVQVRLQNAIAIDGRGYPGGKRVEAETDEKGAFAIKGPKGFAQLLCRKKGYYHQESPKHLYDMPSEGSRSEWSKPGRS